MNEPRKQHYVPQVYLKNFSFGTPKNPKLFVMQVRPRKLFQASVSDTAAERDFYTVNSLDDKHIWERHYAHNIEPMLSELLEKARQNCENSLVQNHSVVINAEEKIRFSLSIIFQMLRGKQARKLEKKLYDEILPTVVAEAKKRYAPLCEARGKAFQSIESDEKYFKEISMQVNFREESIMKYLDCLTKRSFIFYRIIGKESFVSSDNPVVFMDANTMDTTPFMNGMTNATTVIYYPLSSKLLLALYHPHFMGGLSRFDCCLEIIDNCKEDEFVHTHNRKQKEQCYRFVYAESESVLLSL